MREMYAALKFHSVRVVPAVSVCLGVPWSHALIKRAAWSRDIRGRIRPRSRSGAITRVEVGVGLGDEAGVEVEP